MEEPDEDEPYAYGGQLIPRWYHVDCFIDDRADLHNEITADMLTGYKHLKKPDQEMLAKKFGGTVQKGCVSSTLACVSAEQASLFIQYAMICVELFLTVPMKLF